MTTKLIFYLGSALAVICLYLLLDRRMLRRDLEMYARQAERWRRAAEDRRPPSPVETVEPSPRPWSVTDGSHFGDGPDWRQILDADGNEVFLVHFPIDPATNERSTRAHRSLANARLTVKAVNSWGAADDLQG